MFTSGSRRFILGIILTWLVIEGFLRSPAASVLPRPDSSYWHYGIVQYKLDSLKKMAPVDVLFISSSLMWDAISPATFTQRIQQLTGRTWSAYNIGLPLLDAGTSQIALDEQLVAVNGRPLVYLVYGISFVEMAQPGWHSTALNAVRGASVVSDPGSLTQQLMHWIYENVYVLRYRTALQLAFQPPEMTDEDTDSYGFHTLNRTFDQETYLKTNEQPAQRYVLDDGQFERLQALIDYCKAHKIMLILVDLPHHAALFEKNHIPSELAETYHKRLRAMALASNVPLIDISLEHPSWIEDPAYFYDELHINANGAQQLTNRFADFFAKLIS